MVIRVSGRSRGTTLIKYITRNIPYFDSSSRFVKAHTALRFAMRFDISILQTSNQPHTFPPNHEDGGTTHLMKRAIDVGPTVSAIVAMVYLTVWIAGVFLCCCCLGRSRKIRTLFIWKGHRMRADNLRDRPTSEGSNGPPGVHGEVPKKVAMPVEHDPWAGAISRLHQKPPKSKGKGKGKHGSFGSSHDHRVAPEPVSPQKSLSSINGESTSNRISTDGSKAIPCGHDNGAQSRGLLNAPRAVAQPDIINLSMMNHPADTNSYSQNQTSAFPSFSGNTPYDAYGTPVHQSANAATSARCLRLDTPLTADSDISRQLQTPSFDPFPLPPRLSTRSPQREDDLLTTSRLPHGTITLTADRTFDTQ